MKKKARLALITFCALLLVAAVIGSWTRFFTNRNLYAFDAEGFVADQESLLGRVASECRGERSRSAERCVDWGLVAWAWNSSAPAELGRLLDESCSSGSVLSCQRLSRIEEARRVQYWQQLDVTKEVNSEPWPRIAELADSRPIGSWLEIALHGAMAAPGSGVDLACGQVVELPETLVCVSQGNKQMNNALGRVVSYIEQGNKILSPEEHYKNPLLRFWQGFNLRRDDFEKAVALIGREGQPRPDEERLWAWMLARPWTSFLSFSAQSVFTGVPSHEFLHGLYFQSSDFRNVVVDTLSDTRKGLERLKLFVLKIFDTRDPFILNNEMQAYLLQHQSFFQDRTSDAARNRIVRDFSLKSREFDLNQFMAGY